MTRHGLGKRPAAPQPRDFAFTRYKVATGPTPPARFGFDHFIATDDWDMLGNDRVGDCVFAGAAHEVMVDTGGNHRTPARFSDASVLSDYSAVTGWHPADPATDQGTDPHDALRYRRTTGVADAAGNRHKVGAYVWLEPGNWDDLIQATYLFNKVGVGIEFPESAFDQFDTTGVWEVVKGSPIEGGHYVVVTGRPSVDTVNVVTWGRLIRMTRSFYLKYNDESVASIGPDELVNGRSLRGFDLATLQSDLAAL